MAPPNWNSHPQKVGLIWTVARAMLVQVEVQEGDLQALADRLLHGVDGVVDRLIGVLAGVEMDGIVLQQLGPVAATQGCQLLGQLIRLSGRQEGKFMCLPALLSKPLFRTF